MLADAPEYRPHGGERCGESDYFKGDRVLLKSSASADAEEAVVVDSRRHVDAGRLDLVLQRAGTDELEVIDVTDPRLQRVSVGLGAPSCGRPAPSADAPLPGADSLIARVPLRRADERSHALPEQAAGEAAHATRVAPASRVGAPAIVPDGACVLHQAVTSPSPSLPPPAPPGTANAAHADGAVDLGATPALTTTPSTSPAESAPASAPARTRTASPAPCTGVQAGANATSPAAVVGTAPPTTPSHQLAGGTAARPAAVGAVPAAQAAVPGAVDRAPILEEQLARLQRELSERDAQLAEARRQAQEKAHEADASRALQAELSAHYRGARARLSEHEKSCAKLRDHVLHVRSHPHLPGDTVATLMAMEEIIRGRLAEPAAAAAAEYGQPLPPPGEPEAFAQHARGAPGSAHDVPPVHRPPPSQVAGHAGPHAAARWPDGLGPAVGFAPVSGEAQHQWARVQGTFAQGALGPGGSADDLARAPAAFPHAHAAQDLKYAQAALPWHPRGGPPPLEQQRHAPRPCWEQQPMHAPDAWHRWQHPLASAAPDELAAQGGRCAQYEQGAQAWRHGAAQPVQWQPQQPQPQQPAQQPAPPKPLPPPPQNPLQPSAQQQPQQPQPPQPQPPQPQPQPPQPQPQPQPQRRAGAQPQPSPQPQAAPSQGPAPAAQPQPRPAQPQQPRQPAPHPASAKAAPAGRLPDTIGPCSAALGAPPEPTPPAAAAGLGREPSAEAQRLDRSAPPAPSAAGLPAAAAAPTARSAAAPAGACGSADASGRPAHSATRPPEAEAARRAAPSLAREAERPAAAAQAAQPRPSAPVREAADAPPEGSPVAPSPSPEGTMLIRPVDDGSSSSPEALARDEDDPCRLRIDAHMRNAGALSQMVLSAVRQLPPEYQRGFKRRLAPWGSAAKETDHPSFAFWLSQELEQAQKRREELRRPSSARAPFLPRLEPRPAMPAGAAGGGSEQPLDLEHAPTQQPGAREHGGGASAAAQAGGAEGVNDGSSDGVEVAGLAGSRGCPGGAASSAPPAAAPAPELGEQAVIIMRLHVEVEADGSSRRSRIEPHYFKAVFKEGALPVIGKTGLDATKHCDLCRQMHHSELKIRGTQMKVCIVCARRRNGASADDGGGATPDGLTRQPSARAERNRRAISASVSLGRPAALMASYSAELGGGALKRARSDPLDSHRCPLSKQRRQLSAPQLPPTAPPTAPAAPPPAPPRAPPRPASPSVPPSVPQLARPQRQPSATPAQQLERTRQQLRREYSSDAPIYIDLNASPETLHTCADVLPQVFDALRQIASTRQFGAPLHVRCIDEAGVRPARHAMQAGVDAGGLTNHMFCAFFGELPRRRDGGSRPALFEALEHSPGYLPLHLPLADDAPGRVDADDELLKLVGHGALKALIEGVPLGLQLSPLLLLACRHAGADGTAESALPPPACFESAEVSIATLRWVRHGLADSWQQLLDTVRAGGQDALDGLTWDDFARGSARADERLRDLAELEEAITLGARQLVTSERERRKRGIAAFARGLCSYEPLHKPLLDMAVGEMAGLLCGRTLVSGEQLVEQCDVGGLPSDAVHSRWVRQVITSELSDDHRLKFLEFVTGLRCLPLAGLRPRIVISFGKLDADGSLPVAKTCMHELWLRDYRTYPSVHALRDDVVKAICNVRPSDFLLK